MAVTGWVRPAGAPTIRPVAPFWKARYDLPFRVYSQIQNGSRTMPVRRCSLALSMFGCTSETCANKAGQTSDHNPLYPMSDFQRMSLMQYAAHVETIGLSQVVLRAGYVAIRSKQTVVIALLI